MLCHVRLFPSLTPYLSTCRTLIGISPDMANRSEAPNGLQDNRTTEKRTHVGGGRGGKYSAACRPKRTGQDGMEWERISWFDGLIGHNVRSDHRYRFCHFTFV